MPQKTTEKHRRTMSTPADNDDLAVPNDLKNILRHATTDDTLSSDMIGPWSQYRRWNSPIDGGLILGHVDITTVEILSPRRDKSASRTMD